MGGVFTSPTPLPTAPDLSFSQQSRVRVIEKTANDSDHCTRIQGVTVLALVLAYLLGAVPAATIVARARGVDIRKVGSGNSGATNVQRSLGWGPGLLVAVFDILKGALAVWLARLAGLGDPSAALCGVAAVIGHNFSVFLRFRGGKGVATSFGTILAIDPLIGAGALVLGLSTMVLTRYVSAGSVLGAVATVVLALSLPRPWWERGLLAFLALLLIWQHRDNLRRLVGGTERRFGEQAAAPTPPQAS